MNRICTLTGSVVALATPFRDHAVDSDGLAALCERQIDRGTRALVVCGSAGEASSLSAMEYSCAVRTVVETSRGRLPVIAGCSAMATEAATDLAVAAQAAGADGVLCARRRPLCQAIAGGHFRACAGGCARGQPAGHAL